jgi:DNA-binding response OmpR family regulator
MEVETTKTPCRVLVVDDDADTAYSLRAVLSLWGYDVRTAATGPDALSAALEYQPEAVLLDLAIPGLDGYDVARTLSHSPHPPFIAVISGYGTKRDRIKSAEAGADVHLVKPADPLEIKAILETRSADPPAEDLAVDED